MKTNYRGKVVKGSKGAAYRIQGSVFGHATRQPIRGITVTVSEARNLERPSIGHGATGKDGKFDLVLKPPATRTKDAALRVALSLIDGKGRPILAREHLLSINRNQDVRIHFALPGVEHGVNLPDIRYIEGEPVNIQAAGMLRRDANGLPRTVSCVVAARNPNACRLFARHFLRSFAAVRRGTIAAKGAFRAPPFSHRESGRC